jgi:hypothetical protein
MRAIRAALSAASRCSAATNDFSTFFFPLIFNKHKLSVF